jgi:hypothetical protein
MQILPLKDQSSMLYTLYVTQNHLTSYSELVYTIKANSHKRSPIKLTLSWYDPPNVSN